MESSKALHRKQYLVSSANLDKIAAIQASQGKSATQVVREAIEAYNPNSTDEDVLTPESVIFLQGEIKTAIAETQKANDRVEALLHKLGESE